MPRNAISSASRGRSDETQRTASAPLDVVSLSKFGELEVVMINTRRSNSITQAALVHESFTHQGSISVMEVLSATTDSVGVSGLRWFVDPSLTHNCHTAVARYRGVGGTWYGLALAARSQYSYKLREKNSSKTALFRPEFGTKNYLLHFEKLIAWRLDSKFD